MRISESGTIEVVRNERLTIHISTSSSLCRAELSGLVGSSWRLPPRSTGNLLLAQLTPEQDSRFTASFKPGIYRATIRGNPGEQTFTEQIDAAEPVSRTYEVVIRP